MVMVTFRKRGSQQDNYVSIKLNELVSHLTDTDVHTGTSSGGNVVAISDQ